ncbi:hypothetical protein EPN18_05930 [bacterium]|nr:MAG: hypothetical protein EPN18_05930 [bacterium]
MKVNSLTRIAKISALTFSLAALLQLAPFTRALSLCHAVESITETAELPRAKRPSAPWGKDPFVPLVSATSTHNGLKLSAIFYNSTKPSAIINGNIVSVGSIITGQKVIAIDKTHVILQGETGKVRLDIASAPEPDDEKK